MKRIHIMFLSLGLILCMGAWGFIQAANTDKVRKISNKLTHEQRQAAASRAKADGMTMEVPGTTTMATPGSAPHYFSHPNYANSPLPTFTAVPGTLLTVGNPLNDRFYATDNAAEVFVVLGTPLPEGFIQSFQTLNQAAAGGSVQPSAGLSFHAYVLRPTGNTNEYTVEFDSGLLTVPPLADATVSAVATFPVANFAVQNGDLLAFYGQGVPLDVDTGTDAVYYPTPTAPLEHDAITLGGSGFPLYPQTRTYSFSAEVVSPDSVVITGGIRKFVNGLPGLGSAAANNLGQYIPVAVPDTTTYPGSDYYEIGLVQYMEQLHTNLPSTTLRGYVQLGTGVVAGSHDLGNGYTSVDPPHYLGPTIVAHKNTPVRILFRNLLPPGQGGNLFIPVDTTVMGSGMGPNMPAMEEPDPQNPMCGADPKPNDCFTENRATLHLHGGITPWISDGTPHQWITPADDTTPYPKGVSVKNVPDMPDPDPGAQTFYYTNQQSARLMFYHDHAWGITRLNVYAGEAAGYVLRDDVEQSLIDNQIIPSGLDEIPLIIQDKTFVPDEAQLAVQDETWDMTRWGGEGSLWVPHVYSPAQNPGDASGVNQFGRWAYGPWFWPPTNVENGPIDNPYHNPLCDSDLGWCEPAMMPGTPYLSMGMEAFNDTPMVNGTVYPTITLDPKPYRLRILSAANDRFFNLSLYKAVDANGVPCDLNSNPNPAPESTGVACTEVALNPAEVAAALEDPAGVFPTPLAGTEGPDWIQIGTEGGFLPSPVVIPPHVITWVTDPTVFNAGNVDQHSLLLAPAERADVIVDFSQHAGQTLILYNDAPAAFPARDPRYDYYTGNPDLRDVGGAPSTLPGYGPNTRTVMRIKINSGAVQAFNLGGLQSVLAHQLDANGNPAGVFEAGQNPIVVAQNGYNNAYGTTFPSNTGLVQIYDTSLTFRNILDTQLTLPLRPKQIQDEQGEAFDHTYGRMSGFLGVETPNSQAGQQNMILYPYTYPPTEILDGLEVPSDGAGGIVVTPINSLNDGTQIWKITHNGVDTHPIHWHLYEVQILNRVGWDGIIRKPDLNELGWKDTFRVSPLEDTIIALRPIIPQLPFDLPNSLRVLDPSRPEGEFLEAANTTQREAAGLPIFAFNPDGDPIDIVNHVINFGWEYVWHCHILSHEEMDMMRSQAVGVAPKAPSGVTYVLSGNGNNKKYDITWTDNSTNETAFVIERRVAGSTNGWTVRATVPSSVLNVIPYVENGIGPGTGLRTYSDRIGNTNTLYEYQVYALNEVGDSWDYSNPNLNQIPPGGGFPTHCLKRQSRSM